MENCRTESLRRSSIYAADFLYGKDQGFFIELRERISNYLDRNVDRISIEIASETGKPFKYIREEILQTIREIKSIRIPEDLHEFVKPGVSALNYNCNDPVLSLFVPLFATILQGSPVLVFANPYNFVSAHIIISMLSEIGLPEGVVNVIPFKPNFNYAYLYGENFSYFQDTYDGLGINRIIQSERHKPATVLWGDIDPDSAVSEFTKRLVRMPFSNEQLLVVDRRMFEYVLNRLKEELSRIVVGDPADGATDLGPVTKDEDLMEALSIVGKYRVERLLAMFRGVEGNLMKPAIILTDDVVKDPFVHAPLVYLVNSASVEDAVNLINEVEADRCALFSDDSKLLKMLYGRTACKEISFNSYMYKDYLFKPFLVKRKILM
ncbi:aldehyde dehydrogenase family protein [Thermoplasma volcanium]|uniref:aldehyde dehydrogenase family protein n=1 Tax=Thermoplasma volcanium TaxID=50339 RepID=UPI001389880F|nr:aldehyde dehydrogenase [Thermoplasma volcanium]